MATTVGFIGLGHMGFPMVKNLTKAGFTVKVFDVANDAIARCVAEGAIAAQSVAKAVQDSDVVYTMLQTGDQVLNACSGKDGIFANIKKNALYIDSSSIAIQASLECHQKAEAANIAMVDAPVSGGVKGAENAALTIMVGGSDQNFLRAKPILQNLGKKIIHAGKAGSGQAAKICNNMILGISMIAVSEAFNLAEKLQLDPKKFFEICKEASGQCWSMTSYCPYPGILESAPSNNKYQPGFAGAMMLKDLKLSQDAAEFSQVNTPLGKSATEIYQKFVNSDYGDLDFSAVIQFLKESN